MSTKTRIRVPAKIENQMKQWRQGLIPLPTAYVDFHLELAEASLEELKKQGVIVHNDYMAEDGHGDGMKFLHAIVEQKDGKLSKIKWGDYQHWMAKCESGGWASFRI